MDQRNKKYRSRLIDDTLSDYLNMSGMFGYVWVEGPQWCGKKSASQKQAESGFDIMDPADNYRNKARAEYAPSLVLEGALPRVIAECQEVPGIWDAVKDDIAKNPGTVKYILTSSVTSPQEPPLEIPPIRMRPMTLDESGDSMKAVSFQTIFYNGDINTFTSDKNLTKLSDLIIRGGWPETFCLSAKYAAVVTATYIESIVNNTVFGSSSTKRNLKKRMTLLRFLAENNAQTVNETTLTKDINKYVSLSRNTVSDYIDALKKIFVIEDIPAWKPENHSETRARIRTSPKMMFADPSLAIAVLGIDSEYLLDNLNTLSFMFENLCLRDLCAYAEFYGGSVSHYCDNSGLEVDAIIEMKDGAWGAFEIKLGENQIEAAAKTLLRLKKKKINGNIEPSCLGIITGGGPCEKRKEDGVYVIPINALKR